MSAASRHRRSVRALDAGDFAEQPAVFIDDHHTVLPGNK
jgi:hypothetical protein